MSSDQGPLRIGEFARRVGVSPELLRAWERRYGLLRPVRSGGGFRLYTAEDARRVARMQDALAAGLSAAEAAERALGETPPEGAVLAGAGERLFAAIRAYDEAEVHAVIDDALAAFGFEAVLRELLLPALAQVGDEWSRGTLAVGNEHFASSVIRGRLLALARLWGRGTGPLVLLACAPGEAHDLSLLAFGLVLRSHGWRVVFLGADTPLDTLRETADAVHPALVVVASFDPALLTPAADALAALAEDVPVALGGPGASEQIASRIGARRLGDEVVSAAAQLAAESRDERFGGHGTNMDTSSR